MKTPSTPPRFALILLAFLPGLLVRGGESLRVCLHDWIDFADACQTVAAAEAASPSGGCCSRDAAAGEREGPLLAGGHDCDGCCVDLTSNGTEPSTPAPGAGEPPFPDVSPVVRAFQHVALPPVRATGLRERGPPPTPTGRAPTPLRI